MKPRNGQNNRFMLLSSLSVGNDMLFSVEMGMGENKTVPRAKVQSRGIKNQSSRYLSTHLF